MKSAASEESYAIALAERTRDQFEALAEIGMKIARLEGARATGEAPADPDHDSVVGFERAARAVRGCLVAANRMQAHILALRKGQANTSPVAPWPTMTPGWEELLCQPSPDPRRNRIRAEVWEAIQDVHPPATPKADLMLLRLHERLIEGDDYDALLRRPLREAVETICRDLDIAPDWSRWSCDERGFERDPAQFVFDPVSGWREIDDLLETARQSLEARHPSASMRTGEGGGSRSRPRLE